MREAKRLLSESIIAVEARDVTLEEDDEEIEDDLDKGPVLPSAMRASIAKEERKEENSRNESIRRNEAGLPVETSEEREEREEREREWLQRGGDDGNIVDRNNTAPSSQQHHHSPAAGGGAEVVTTTQIVAQENIPPPAGKKAKKKKQFKLRTKNTGVYEILSSYTSVRKSLKTQEKKIWA